MVKDLRHAARMLLHAKGWTIVGLLSLALGIGANTAIFTALNAMLLHYVAGPPRLSQATDWGLQVMGRVKPGVTAAQVSARTPSASHDPSQTESAP